MSRWVIEYGNNTDGWKRELTEVPDTAEQIIGVLEGLGRGREPWRVRNLDTGEVSPGDRDPQVVALWLREWQGRQATCSNPDPPQMWVLEFGGDRRGWQSGSYRGARSRGEMLEDLRELGYGNQPWRVRCLETGEISPADRDPEVVRAWLEAKPDSKPGSTPPTPAIAQVGPQDLVTLNVRREGSARELVLYVNAKPLHDRLDAAGVRHSRGVYEGGPYSYHSVVAGNKLSTDVFLRRVYPARFPLSCHFGTPPSLRQLKALCESAREVVAEILSHFMTVDLQYKVTVEK